MQERNTMNSTSHTKKLEQLIRRCQAAYCVFDARMRTVTSEPEKGAATAEYAIVLVAATGFAALLAGLLKSNIVKDLILGIIRKALGI